MGELDNWKKGKDLSVAAIITGIASLIGVVAVKKKNKDNNEDVVVQVGNYKVTKENNDKK